MSHVRCPQILWHQGLDAQADQFVVPVPEHLLRPGVGQLDAAVLANHQDRVGGRYQQPPHPLLVPPELILCAPSLGDEGG